MILPFLEFMIAPTSCPHGASIRGDSLLFFSPGINLSGPINRTRVVAEKYRRKLSRVLSKNMNRSTILSHSICSLQLNER